jgi:hypothetical protein
MLQIAGAVEEAPFSEPPRRRLERARLHDIASSGEERLVDRANQVWPCEDQVVVAPIVFTSAEIVGGEVELLNARSHRAVEDEDALGERVEIGLVRGHFMARDRNVIAPLSNEPMSTR